MIPRHLHQIYLRQVFVKYFWKLNVKENSFQLLSCLSLIYVICEIKVVLSSFRHITVNPLQPGVAYLYPSKTSENL